MKNLTYIFDIGSSKISLLACNIHKGRSIIVTSVEKLYDGFMDGEFFSTNDLPDIFNDIVQNMNEKIGGKITSAYIGVPSEFSACVCKRVTRNFTQSKKLNEEEIVKLFDGVNDYSKYADYTVINYSALQYIADGVPRRSIVNVRLNELVMDCSYILVKNSFIELMQNCCKRCGIDSLDFVSTALAQAQLVMQDVEDVLKPVAIVDVGHITTSVAIAKGEGLLMLSSFSLGGGHITADLMQIGNQSYQDAELIKHKVSLTIQSKKDERYIVYNKGKTISTLINITNDIVTSRIENIAHVINQVLSVDDSFKNIPIYLTGDGLCNFRGVKNLLEVVTNRKIYMLTTNLDNGKDKYQTSKIGLANLIGDLI